MLSVQFRDQLILNRFQKRRRIGKGNFGLVWEAYDSHTKDLVALKEELIGKEKFSTLPNEKIILNKLSNCSCVPKVICFGREGQQNFMAMQLLGKSLNTLLKQRKSLSNKTILMIGFTLIDCLESIHTYNVVHQDIKPDNILIGLDSVKRLYLVDFGISRKKSLVDLQKYNQIGTPRFASINAHLGNPQGKKDDLQSLTYVLVYLSKKELPWMNVKSQKNRLQQILQCKQRVLGDELCKGVPYSVQFLINSLKNKKEKDPDYYQIKKIFSEEIFSSYIQQALLFDWMDQKSDSTHLKLSLDTGQQFKTVQLHSSEAAVAAEHDCQSGPELYLKIPQLNQKQVKPCFSLFDYQFN